MKIKCRSTEMVICEQNRLWPCCYTSLYRRESSWQKNQDPDWNSLDKYSADTIIDSEGFAEHYNDKHWNDELMCDEICKKWCNNDEKKGRT
jgi:hypothetical protein